jgi:hypothetical protein
LALSLHGYQQGMINMEQPIYDNYLLNNLRNVMHDQLEGFNEAVTFISRQGTKILGKPVQK